MTIPGIAEDETVALNALLSSGDARLARSALEDIRAGVESGRISASHQDFTDFIGSLVLEVRERDASDGLPTLPFNDPWNRFVLIDLIVHLEEGPASIFLAEVNKVFDDSITLMHSVEQLTRSGRSIPRDLAPLVLRSLASQSSGIEPVDSGLILSIVESVESAFQSTGERPDSQIVDGLLRVLESSASRNIKNRIRDVFERMYL